MEMHNIHTKTTTMVKQTSNYQDDDSSVESDFEEEQGGSGVIIDFDDVSVASHDARPSRMSKATSFESAFSAESSIEADLAPPAYHRPSTRNATWNSNQPGNHQGRFITVTKVPDTGKAPTNSRSGLRRNDAMSGSCGSIKEHLHFGSIHEDAAYDSLGSSDEESDDDSEAEGNVKFEGMHNVSRTIHVSVGDDASEAESSVDDSVINAILRKTDSREKMLGKGKRSTSTSKTPTRKNKAEAKAKGATGDPLLNRFLDTRREKGSPGDRHKGSMLDSILGKTDSLNHVNKLGQRVVKTNTNAHATSRRASMGVNQKRDIPVTNRRASTGSKDPLMDLFLAKKAMQRQSEDGAQDRTNKPVNSCDSLARVDGKGQRLVGTRLGC